MKSHIASAEDSTQKKEFDKFLKEEMLKIWGDSYLGQTELYFGEDKYIGTNNGPVIINHKETSYLADRNMREGGTAHNTIAHELEHSLGLIHPGHYNAGDKFWDGEPGKQIGHFLPAISNEGLNQDEDRWIWQEAERRRNKYIENINKGKVKTQSVPG